MYFGVFLNFFGEGIVLLKLATQLYKSGRIKGETDRETERETDRDRQTDRETERQKL